MPHHVKRRRTYDTTKRRADALARRTAVLASARELFLLDGFAATTVAAVAERGGVSQETVYKNFGGKPGLVRALHEDAMRGEGPVSPYQRSEDLRGQPDPYEIVRGWSRLSMEVAPRVSPLLLLMRDAAVIQPTLRDLLAELDDARHRRMSENAQFLHKAGHLREGVTTRAAADLMWSVTSPEMYELLVVRRAWSLNQYADHILHTVSSLLPPARHAQTPKPP
jgi:AcrR family transcriptional regulator